MKIGDSVWLVNYYSHPSITKHDILAIHGNWVILSPFVPNGCPYPKKIEDVFFSLEDSENFLKREIEGRIEELKKDLKNCREEGRRIMRGIKRDIKREEERLKEGE